MNEREKVHREFVRKSFPDAVVVSVGINYAVSVKDHPLFPVSITPAGAWTKAWKLIEANLN